MKKAPLELLQEQAEYLKKRGYTQYQIADKWGVSPAYLSLVLNGHRPITGIMLEHARVEKFVSYRRIK